MATWSRQEREALCDLLEQLGPDQPTLCTGWTTRDLAAHLVTRERRVDAAAGIIIGPLAGHTERVRARRARRPWPELVAAVRHPPHWSLVTAIGPIESAINTGEYFIHHEDVRRAQPDWQPRSLPAPFEAVLWRHVRTVQARLALRRFRGNIHLVAPGHGELRAGRGTRSDPGGQTDLVRLSGPPSELVLFLSGRQRATVVELTGPPALVERLRSARLGV